MKQLSLQPFPIDDALPRLNSALRDAVSVVLSAPPGAGKTTRVPVALLSSLWLEGRKIVMLEPRRLAARRAAEFMASQFGERVGETVGYRIRGETKVSSNTRIEVLTEGILTRMLQREPDLPGIGMVIFDEFHERSIHADLGLALTLDAQLHLRNDLRVLVMSATLDGLTIASVLGDTPVVESAGRGFPVTTHYARFSSEKRREVRVVDAVIRALQTEEGDILVFLPGRREIRRTEQMLWERKISDDVLVHTLHGEASYASQAEALALPPPGKRKVILATNVAETSLTIEGVRVVIDSGLVRVSRFDPRRGMSGLITVSVSKASADQRRGRAGRIQPGVCYRLWTEQEHTQLSEYSQPEIKSADLAPLALELELWGSPMGDGLKFIDPPPQPHLQQARSLLADLGALDASAKLNAFGRAMTDLPIHPRLAAMILKAKELGYGPVACTLAALLEERDLLAGKNDGDVDLFSRWHALNTGRNAANERVMEQSRRLRELAGVPNEPEDERALGLLLALAYPERVARRRDAGTNKFIMASGLVAVLPPGSPLTRQEYLAIGDVDGIGAEARVFLAAPLNENELRQAFGDRIVGEEEVRWSQQEEAVVARRVLRLGAIILSEQRIDPPDERIAKALAGGVEQMGLESLPWTKEARLLQERSEWLRKNGFVAEDWPDVSPETLLRTLDNWLTPFLEGMRRRAQLAALDLLSILKSRFSYELLQELDRLAPSHLKLPSGSRIALDYSSEAQPALAVRLQELFGQVDTPRIAGGRVAVVVHLLSPARRPLAVTQDLQSFWKTLYPELRTQMRARYPKHFWPENPLTAQPTSKPLRRK